ncbi:uncharacterized protein LOC128263518 [Drosophila gunungcola]|uniref:Uncharacterized protein n=1 Tax=Drosophila gunungcola TaxID=103775 RepID=A0A9Q0BTF8_9MUSC|nr:uncharacterized protein LOC128263518 [Drosophila gunungcola]XP_052854565.1 uncharacterized protein LOC128263518 [Drosophila gunungcola]KAI8043280.1 hypothetical protein M5D96_004607 [Drosophila gunungcola]
MFESFDWNSGLYMKNYRDVKQRVVKKIGDLERRGVMWGRLVGIEDGKDDVFFRFMRENV